MVKTVTQQTIWDNVKSLLFRHDCVIVPNFGGFVCNREQSKIDQVSHVITPPAKRVIFNQNLKTNDGLLAQNIALAVGVSYTEALFAIEEVVVNLKNKLEVHKQLEIDQFGVFRLNAEANYVFLPNKVNNYLHSSYGLMPLQATPVAEMAHGSRKTRIFKDRKEIRQARSLKKRQSLGLKILTACVIAVLGINGFILLTEKGVLNQNQMSTTGIHTWFDSLFASNQNSTDVPTPTQTTQTDSQQAYIPQSPVAETDSTLVEQPMQTEPSIENHTLNVAQVFANTSRVVPYFGEQYLTENGTPAVNQLDSFATQTETPVETTIEPTNIEIPSPQKVFGDYTFHVIGGVFCNEENARKFYYSLKARGFDAELLLNKKINCNRVSYKKCSTREEANALVDSLKTVDNPDIWVLVVKE